MADPGALIADLLVSRASVEIPAPDTGTLEGDLMVLTTASAAALRGPNLAILRAAVSTSAGQDDVTAAFRIYWAERTRIVAAIIERAVQRGEAPAGTDPDLVLQAAAGPLWLIALSHAAAPPTDTLGPTSDHRAAPIPATDDHPRHVAHLVVAAIRAGARRDSTQAQSGDRTSTARTAGIEGSAMGRRRRGVLPAVDGSVVVRGCPCSMILGSLAGSGQPPTTVPATPIRGPGASSVSVARSTCVASSSGALNSATRR